MQNHLQRRGAGVLLPISSLPSPYGIGTFGQAAYDFVDWLAEAGQRYWQILPLSLTGFGNSPYQSCSAFAGNPYFIDLDLLMADGLLTKEEADAADCGTHSGEADYARLFQKRYPALRRAFARAHCGEALRRFAAEQAYWLEDYCLYMALKTSYGDRAWNEWEGEARFFSRDILLKYRKQLAGEISFWAFCQFEFDRQWRRLKEYANAQGIRIIGDCPLYVSFDSADVWARRRLFELDDTGVRPRQVAGVPPDAYSSEERSWGNPIYDWQAMEREGFRWWAERIAQNARLYDVIRLDHFIGIARFYSIPYAPLEMERGVWRTGPGLGLVEVIRRAAGERGAALIMEDLGVLTPEVRALAAATGWPSMRVLEFAFNGDPHSEHLPHHFTTPNLVVYSATHDNEPLAGFYGAKPPEALRQVMAYLQVERREEIPRAMIRLAYASIAATVIVPAQDVLGLGNEARLCAPGKAAGAWQWRLTPGRLGKEAAAWLRGLAELYGR